METISPDAAVLLEDLLRMGNLRRRDFCARHDIRSIGLLPLSDWVGATGWIKAQAALKGYTLAEYPYPNPPAPPVEKTLSAKAREIMDRAGSRKAGGSLFDQPGVTQ